MKRYTPNSMAQMFMWCREAITLAGYEFHSAEGRFNILAVRGLYPDKQRVVVNGHALPGETHSLIEQQNITGRHDDVMIVHGILPEAKGGFERGALVARTFPASVDPGIKYTKHPVNARGCAHLCNGQWRYTTGIHRGHHAFVQAEQVRIWRDKNRDGVYEDGEKFTTGHYGINIHASAPHKSDDPWSAGCQVIEGGWDGDYWRRFHAVMLTFGIVRRIGFYYTLIGFDAWAQAVQADGG